MTLLIPRYGWIMIAFAAALLLAAGVMYSEPGYYRWNKGITFGITHPFVAGVLIDWSGDPTWRPKLRCTNDRRLLDWGIFHFGWPT